MTRVGARLFRLAAFGAVSGALMLGAAADLPGASGDPEAGRSIFKQKCRKCHGTEGKGDGELADSLSPRPKDLTSAGTQARRDEALRRIILEGRPGTSMDGWAGVLSEGQVTDLIAYIRSLKR